MSTDEFQSELPMVATNLKARVSISKWVNEAYPPWDEILSTHDVARLTRCPRWPLFDASLASASFTAAPSAGIREMSSVGSQTTTAVPQRPGERQPFPCPSLPHSRRAVSPGVILIRGMAVEEQFVDDELNRPNGRDRTPQVGRQMTARVGVRYERLRPPYRRVDSNLKTPPSMRADRPLAIDGLSTGSRAAIPASNQNRRSSGRLDRIRDTSLAGATSSRQPSVIGSARVTALPAHCIRSATNISAQ